MIALFGEALTTAFFPCSLVLVLPSLALALGGRRHSAAAIGMFVVGLIASSWSRFAGYTSVWPSLLVGAAFLLAGLLFLLPGRLPEQLSNRPVVPAVLAGLAVGGATGSLWRPCVGIEFGEVLTGLDQSGVGGLLDHSIYAIGVMGPMIAFTAVANALPPAWIERANRPLAWIGGGLLVLLGLAVFAGLDDHVIDRLFALSSF